ncbi:hypothetical protein EST38_g11300 [Candolleomyces aberdarensis]|uniref:AB hydrolase-1 domain-containing protein n=1 Tax=Candolleomyces aberdarensis TaxID=2316362 RepID=A0A4Q2D570_9AGAR|nr:hypothetical protein EST38_g11300 [Candolleomyces aberdarensis]
MESLQSGYKEVSVSRGYKYRYYFSAPEPGKLSLLLAHGFPSLAIDWRYQIAYFKAKGYGLVVPDMLGYGGTDKPVNHKEYLHSLLAKDLVDILDHERVTNVIAIGHDWGSKTTSVLANLFSERFLGFAFFAMGYMAPNPSKTYEELQEEITKAVGYNTFGYWGLFAAPDGAEIIEKHIESFWDLVHPKDPRIWKYNTCPPGAARVFCQSDTRTPRDPAHQELQPVYEKEFSKGGWVGPLSYYKVALDGDAEDSKKIPLENYTIKKPIFIGCAKKDVICVPALSKSVAAQFCPQATIEEFDTGHWVLTDAPDEVNSALDKWINSIVA